MLIHTFILCVYLEIWYREINFRSQLKYFIVVDSGEKARERQVKGNRRSTADELYSQRCAGWVTLGTPRLQQEKEKVFVS
jgi:hypothetical protein